MERDEIELRVDELRAAHPGRREFIAAVREYAESLDAEGHKLLGEALLQRGPETSGFDVLNEHGGWFRRRMRKIEGRGRP